MIYEIGIILRGHLILHRKYYALKKIDQTLTPERRSQLLRLITDLSGHVLDKKINSVSNKEYKIYFSTFEGNEMLYKNLGLFIYAIGDMYSDILVVLPLLGVLVTKFLKVFPAPDLDSNLEETTPYSPFGEEIDKVLRDERLSPSDRVRISLLNKAL